LCVTAGPNTYTMIGKRIDGDGHIIDPVRADWAPGAAFVTPPGWWHSHHNDSSEDAIVLPIQDAALYTHLQTLDIRFSKGH
jgi:gentisate 1,2-dioxygenase